MSTYWASLGAGEDIARELGVSIVTVSKVLRNHSDISDETRERVLKRMKGLNYRPNLAARALVTGTGNLRQAQSIEQKLRADPEDLRPDHAVVVDPFLLVYTATTRLSAAGAVPLGAATTTSPWAVSNSRSAPDTSPPAFPLR